MGKPKGHGEAKLGATSVADVRIDQELCSKVGKLDFCLSSSEGGI